MNANFWSAACDAPVECGEFMTLSSNCVLYYVLRESGVRGQLTEGNVELHERKGILVYDRYGTPNEYISGEHLSSWSVVRDGVPVPG
jgi:hypothetical protein